MWTLAFFFCSACCVCLLNISWQTTHFFIPNDMHFVLFGFFFLVVVVVGGGGSKGSLCSYNAL